MRWILLLLLAPFVSSAQDIHFSQADMVPYNYSPASTGLFDGDIRGMAVERTQWRSVTTPYQTFGIAVDARDVGSSNGTGVGLSILQDRAGDGRLSTLSVNAQGSLHIPISKDSLQILSVGLGLGFTHMSVDPDAFQFDSQWNGSAYDPTWATGEQFQRTARTYANMSLGVAYQKRWKRRNEWQAALSLNNLTRPDQSFFNDLGVKLRGRTSLASWARLEVSEEWDVIPTLLWQAQGEFRELLMGAQARYLLSGNTEVHQAVLGGFAFRTQDAGYIVLGGEYGPWKAGLSYDINLSNLQPASNGKGGLEIAVHYIHKVFEPGSIPRRYCPDFL